MQEGHLIQTKEFGRSLNEMSKDYPKWVGVHHTDGADVLGKLCVSHRGYVWSAIIALFMVVY